MDIDSSTYYDPTNVELAEGLNYVTKGPVARGRSGFDLDETDKQHIRDNGAGQSISRIWSVSFHDEYEVEDIADRAGTVTNQLGGTIAVGVHDEPDSNPNLHIFQVGPKSDCWMQTQEFRDFKDDLGAQFPNEGRRH